MQLLTLLRIGWGEILVIALIVLLLFGARKIPELMRGMGKGVKSFKDGMNGVEDEAKDASKTETKQETSKSDSEKA